MNRLLVVRFPNGSWSYGGKENDPDYEQCEKFWIETNKSKGFTPQHAIRIAQNRRQQRIRRERNLNADPSRNT